MAWPPTTHQDVQDAVTALRTRVFDVRNYGAKADGTTDDRAALQAAVDDAIAAIATGKGAAVQLAPGVHLLGSSHPTPPATHAGASLGVRLPVNLAARLTIRGAGTGVTTLKLSDAARCAFWIGQAADYDVFRNVTIEDLDVDNANTAGRCHVLIGSQPEYNTTQKYLSFSDLTFRRLRTYGYSVDLTQNTQYKSFIALLGDHATGDGASATQSYTRNIVAEDITMTDVQQGVLAFTRFGNGATNHWYDQIRIARCSHQITTFPGQILDQTSFFVCGAGKGGYCEVVDCYSENTGDDGVEVGAMQTIVIDRFRIKNPFLIGIYIRQAQSPPDADAQTITIRDYNYTADATLNSGSGNPVARPLSFISDDAAAWMGTINLERPVVSSTGQRFTKMSRGTEKDIGLLVAAPARRALVTGLRLHIRGMVFDQAYSEDFNLIQPNLYPPHLADPTWQYSLGQFILRDAEVQFTGASTTTTNLANVHALWPVGQGSVDVDGLNVQANQFTIASGGGGGLTLAQLGRGGDLGIIRLRRIRGIADSAPVGRQGIVLRWDSGWQACDIDGCDFRSWTTGGAADVNFDSAPTWAAWLLTLGRANRWSNMGTASYGGYFTVSGNATLNPTATVVGVTSTAAARTITLPSAGLTPVGTVLTVKDESGAANATNSIAVAAPSGQTLDGAASKTITTAYGLLRVYSNGSNWLTA